MPGGRPRLHGVADGDRDGDQHRLRTERARPEHDRTRAARERDAWRSPHLCSSRSGTGAFGALSAAGLALTTFTEPVGARPVTIDLKQSIAATEPLLSGGYGKTVVFTLTATTP